MCCGNVGGNWDRRKKWITVEMTDCERNAVMLHPKVSKCFDILQGVAQRCALTPTLFKAFITDRMKSNVSKKGVEVGKIPRPRWGENVLSNTWVKNPGVYSSQGLNTSGTASSTFSHTWA